MNQTLERSWFNQHRSQNQHPKRHPATPSRRPDDPRHDDNQTSTPSKTFKRWSQVLRMRCNIWSKVSGFWTSQSQEFLETKSLASENWNNASKRLKGANQIGKTSHHILSMDPYTKNRSKSNLHLHGTMDKNPTKTNYRDSRFFFWMFFSSTLQSLQCWFLLALFVECSYPDSDVFTSQKTPWGPLFFELSARKFMISWSKVSN